MIRTPEELHMRALVWRGIAAWCVLAIIGLAVWVR